MISLRSPVGGDSVATEGVSKYLNSVYSWLFMSMYVLCSTPSLSTPTATTPFLLLLFLPVLPQDPSAMLRAQGQPLLSQLGSQGRCRGRAVQLILS